VSNFLDNGAILPHGLLGVDHSADMHGFNKSYKNYPLRIGVVIAGYPVGDPKNKSGLTSEYDVQVTEQMEDRGATAIVYRNCIAAEALGSIADFFEKSLRVKKAKTTSGQAIDLKGQNGAIVLLLCLDGMSDKGIIISALTHPDRKTTLIDEGPRLEGAYNGINIKVEKDGSTTLTFNGATDHDGKVVKDQGTTVLGIEKDGSFQFQHKTITHRLDKNGQSTLTTDDNITNKTKKDAVTTADGNISLTATKDFALSSVKMAINASGSASLAGATIDLNSQGALSLEGSQITLAAQSMASIKASNITLTGNVALGGPGGQPVLIMSTMFQGIGNLGLPVISFAISGFATKVTAQ
jgi:hypothetical protein